MDAKQANRRRFLKAGAALAGVAVGARSAHAHVPGSAAPTRLATHAMAFGERLALRHRHAPDDIEHRPEHLPARRAGGARCVHAAAGPGGQRHPFGPALRVVPRQRPPGHRSRPTSARDLRHGEAAAGVHDGRARAPAVRLPTPLHRVRRQPADHRGEDRRADARDDRLQRVDRRAALRVARRGGRGTGGELGLRGRGRIDPARREPPDGQGPGRRDRRVRPERGAGASAPGLPAAARGCPAFRASITSSGCGGSGW